MKVKEALDELFKDVKFDKKLLDSLVKFNIDFITTNDEIKDMMGSRLFGCFHVSYTQYHKNIFYQDLFGFNYDDAVDAVKKISSIPRNFKVARDDVNLITFYIAHRFLTSSLDKKDKERGAMEILNYFGYRAIVLLNANYWPFPITRGKAASVIEVLSGNYLITKMKNWNEYVHYRSDAYLKSKFLKLLQSFDKDRDIPNAIVDLYNRYKDVMKNIYRELEFLEDTNHIRTTSSVVTDLDGQEVLMDRLSDPIKYSNKVIDSLTSKDEFIKPDVIEVSTSIVNSVSQEQLNRCLELMTDYFHGSPNQSKRVNAFIQDFVSDSISYLQKNRMHLNNRSSVVDVVNLIVGNLLYSRGNDITITEVKARGEELLSVVYKKGKESISSRDIKSVRNAFCIYIFIIGII